MHTLLKNADGAISSNLEPLANALTAARQPRSVLIWVRRRLSSNLLAALVRDDAELTHERLDELPQDHQTRYVRQILVSTDILPQRHEELHQLGLWVRDIVGSLPSHQQQVVRPFAEWGVLRAARRRATRRHYTRASAANDRNCVRFALDLLCWLDDQELTLDGLTQFHMDRWINGNATRSRHISSFIRWTNARHLTSGLRVHLKLTGGPSRFITGNELSEQLSRCLNDDTLPVDIRIVGALTRLYALPVSRVLQLKASQYYRDGDNAYLTVSRHPVLLPPKLAHLIERQLNHPVGRTLALRVPPQKDRYLITGLGPHRGRSSTFTDRMRERGLPTLSARNTAMLESITGLPPIVVSDLFGVHASTANHWAAYANDSWSHYLAALREEE
ncbi:hypothetical protein [Streptomyces buecherae]|uniref:hypothetical protein n=1 Tax=Streptomyces buecherae TaxID=2763006 RepID=UPI0037A13AA3